MGRLHDLYEVEGQSPWLDNVRRDWLRGGQMAQYLGLGVRGVTSNPTIFAKAMESESDYDEQFRSLAGSHNVEEAYWELAITDIVDALELLRPLYEQSSGTDGFVSLEVSPALANDGPRTLAAARDLHQRIDRPNLLVKVPGTPAGVGALRPLFGEGRSINVTLIFSVDRHRQVMEAYISGLEDLAASGTSDLSHVASVASFFISRVDTEVDRRLERLAAEANGDPAILACRGRAAVAQGQLAYKAFLETFSGPRWEALAAKGARVQRPLWASTSTKNPSYSDLLYVDSLIGPSTVNTMPEATLEAFDDHGTVARTVDADPAAAGRTFDELEAKGIDFADVAATLEDEGVASFDKSFQELLQVLSDKAAALGIGGMGHPASSDPGS